MRNKTTAVYFRTSEEEKMVYSDIAQEKNYSSLSEFIRELVRKYYKRMEKKEF